MTPGQQWRRRRDLTIAVLAALGISQRFIADVFDLPRSRVAAILKEVLQLRKSERASVGLQRLAPLIWAIANIEKASGGRRKTGE